MCEASHWSKIHSYICITCYILCVFCDVHTHTVEGATEDKTRTYDHAINGSDMINTNMPHRFTSQGSNTVKDLCGIKAANSSFHHLDQLLNMILSSTKRNGDVSGIEAFGLFLKKFGLGEIRKCTTDNCNSNENKHNHDHEPEHEHEHEHEHEYETMMNVNTSDFNEKIGSNQEELKPKCFSAPDYYDSIKLSKSCNLNQEQFKEICPTILYQMVDQSCVEVTKRVINKPRTSTVWGCSIAAVIVISLVGLLAVALIPLMKKGFYNILVQYLIALGVGTLVGDAILHLIPHALVSHDHSHEGNDKQMQDTVWKTSMSLLGIYIFFLTERLTTMIQSYRVRQRIKRRRTRLSEKRALPTNGIDEVSVAIIRSDSRYATGDREGINLARTTTGNSASSVPTEVGSLGDSGFDLGKLVISDHGHSHSHSQSRKNDCNVVAEEANRLMHQTPVHHCHSHDFSSIKAIAWTVIMGDGLHNFCDGVAIGAAFMNDLRGGLSTSIAVICHELPHEIGDFAVLLKAGMSVKMAVFYNVLSSIFCLAGMVIGITVGGMHNVTPWVFMLATGMFVYIALVDMLPNLTCDQVDENGQPTADGIKSNRKMVFLVQNMGILSGFAIMLLIALYEDRILT